MIFDGVTPLSTPDRGLKHAMIQAYNDWLADFCAATPDRLVGVAYLPTWDAALAATEARRARKLGLRGALVPTIPGRETPYAMPSEHQYNNPFWDPLWDALEELDMPAHIHVDGGPLAEEFAGDTIVLMSVNKTMMCEPITILTCSGVLERHSKLKFVSVESGVGWMAWFVPWLDLVFERHRYYTGYALKEPPSYYFHRQVYGDVHPGLGGRPHRDVTGVGNIMWGQRLPPRRRHLARTPAPRLRSTWPACRLKSATQSSPATPSSSTAWGKASGGGAHLDISQNYVMMPT